MPIVRLRLSPETVYPTDLRYNPDTDTVQSNVNGDWVDNPDADPRHQTTFPARLTADPACDAAQSVSDALQNQISGIISAIEGASTLFTIAGLILGLFTFGTFDIFISIALTVGGAMVDAGAPSLESALSPATFDTFKCIMFCAFDTNGRLKSGGLEQAMSDISDQIGGLGAFVLNAMLSLAGEGGVNNLAALGTSTGDCSACDCGCGDETIADTIDVYYGTVIERDGCSITIEALPEGSHYAIGTQWNGTQGYKLVHEEIISGAPQTPDQWQWRVIPDTGPIFGLSAPIGTEVQQLVFFDSSGGSGFTVKWKFATP